MAEKRPAESLDWYFNLVMDLVPKGANAPKGYEFMRDLAAAFEEAGGVSVPALQEAGIIILDDAEGTAARSARSATTSASRRSSAGCASAGCRTTRSGPR